MLATGGKWWGYSEETQAWRLASDQESSLEDVPPTAVGLPSVVSDRLPPVGSVSPVGFWIAAAGAAAMVVAVFLPAYSSTAFGAIARNSLIEENGHAGWIIVGAAIAGLGSLVRSLTTGKPTAAPIVIGVLAGGYAIFLGLNHGSRQLCSLADQTVCFEAHAAAGIYLAGVGAFVMAVGGRFMRSGGRTSLALIG